ncbi:hypothetical protein SB658_21910, partial [Bacillus sp. SIMBA_008]|uniref:hypothetical protein n=1 Tax=Bacillus sp. SIMBA_008 TaxID=3085757 RepID=UPI00397B818C
MSLITIETDDSRIVIDTVKPIVSTLETTIDFPRPGADTWLPGEALAVPRQGNRFTKVAADGT